MPTNENDGSVAEREVADGAPTTRRMVADVTVRASVESSSDEPLEGMENVPGDTVAIAGRVAGVLGRETTLTPEQRALASQRFWRLESLDRNSLRKILQLFHAQCRPGTPEDALLADEWFYGTMQHCLLRLHSMNVLREEPTATVARSLRSNVKDLLNCMQRIGILNGSADGVAAERVYQDLCARFIDNPKMRDVMTAEPPNPWAHLPQTWEEMKRQNSFCEPLAAAVLEKYGRTGLTMEELLREPKFATMRFLQSLGTYTLRHNLNIGLRYATLDREERDIVGMLEDLGALDPGWKDRPTAKQPLDQLVAARTRR